MSFNFQNNELANLTLVAERAEFNKLKDWLIEFSKTFEFSSKFSKQLLIVADEIFTNIASYGYPVEPGCVEVFIKFNVEIQELVLIFSDNGCAYNPLAKEELDIKAHNESRTVGGLGIFLVKKIMDTLEYARENDKNVLTLKKILG